MIRFAVDRMLGRLAKWLRHLGYDTIYDPEMSLEKLIEESLAHNRVLITRNKKYDSYPPQLSLLIMDSEKINEQIKLVVKKFKLDVKSFVFSRCSLCNNPVKEISKEDVAGKVPEKVFNYVNRFWQCPECRKIYWMGSHHRRFFEKLKRMGLVKSKKKSRFYRLIPHTADMGIVVSAGTKRQLFINSARAMYDIMAGAPARSKKAQTKRIKIEASSIEFLLRDFLAELLYLFTTSGILFTSFRFKKFTHIMLEAEARGINIAKDSLRKEIKAVTYHQLYVKKRGSRWYSRVIFDT